MVWGAALENSKVGLMDKASVSGAEDCGFESHLGCPPFFFFLSLLQRALGSTQHRDHNSSSLEAEHRSYEPGVAGSIPAWSIQRL